MRLSETGLTIQFITAGEQYRQWSAALLKAIYPEGSPRFGQEAEPEEVHFLTAVFAIRKGEVLGRAVLYHNEGISVDGFHTLLVGNYEAAEDETVANILLTAVERYAVEHRFQCLLGPVAGSTWSDYRFILTEQERPFFTEPQQRIYYAASWRRRGFTEAATYHSSVALLPLAGEDEPAGMVSGFAQSGMDVRPIDTARLAEELEQLYPMVSAAFSHSPFYTPLSQHLFVDKFLRLRQLLDPDCTLIAFAGGQPVGLVLCLPDHYDPDGRTLVLKTIARLPGFDHPTLIPSLGDLLYATASQKGYRRIVHAFMQSGNRSRIRSSQFGGVELRRYAVFRKLVGAGGAV